MDIDDYLEEKVFKSDKYKELSEITDKDKLDDLIILAYNEGVNFGSEFERFRSDH